MAQHLLILGDRDGLNWVLQNERMAFPAHRGLAVSALRPGDVVLLYATRGCFRNPGRDRGRVIGSADVISAVERVDPAVEVGGRTFPLACDLRLVSLAPWGEGVELAPLVDRLRVFPDKTAWTAWMRRPLLKLPDQDARVLVRALRKVAGPPSLAVESYDRWPAGTAG